MREQPEKNRLTESLPRTNRTRIRRLRTFDLALTGMIAGTYGALTLLGGELSFGPVNLRFANALIGLVPIFGWPAVWGVAFGVFLGNILGPNLGPLDIFVSPLFSLLGLVVIQLLRKKSVLAGFAAYSIILSVWVNFLLTLFFNRPYFPMFYFTLTGVSVIVLTLAYFVYKGLIASGLRKSVHSVIQN